MFISTIILNILLAILLIAFAVYAFRARANKGPHQDGDIQTLIKNQSELQGRLQVMTDIFGKRQAELNHTVREQLTSMSQNLGSTLTHQAKSTHENLAKLQERLAVIDSAQNNIQSLAGQVVQLQAILANKQTRGAFGQGRMEAIIGDALPKNAYAFQATLSNNSRPDCLIYMPNNAPSLVVDAKFPLESWQNIRNAASPEIKQKCEAVFRNDIEYHLKEIARKYLIAGETQDIAFMFVPSESIFAAIHENFGALVEKAHHMRVIIVSPSLLMLSVSVVQAILKDANMREQAHLIQAEVIKLMKDVERLDGRVRNLQSHFAKANKDVDEILVSSNKITSRGTRISNMELEAEDSAPHNSLPFEAINPRSAIK